MLITRIARECAGSQIAPNGGERGVRGVPIAWGVDEPVHLTPATSRPTHPPAQPQSR